MEITIKGEPKESAALVLAVQERQRVSVDEIVNAFRTHLQLSLTAKYNEEGGGDVDNDKKKPSQGEAIPEKASTRKADCEMGIRCLCQHFIAFYHQCTDARQADFGEPCANCAQYGQCEAQWMGKIMPIIRRYGLDLKPARPAQKEK